MEDETKQIIIEMTPNSSPVARGRYIVTTAVCVRCHNEVDRSEATLCRCCNGNVWQLNSRLQTFFKEIEPSMTILRSERK